jgi:4-amino-4-deoxy-L-arabinose transferase-like glycosyltransferase
MESRISKIYRQKGVEVLFLLGFCLLIYVLNLGQWDLWNPDEPRYAEVAREMVKGGDWILLHLNGKDYGNKPPLFFWLIAFSSFLWQGFTSFAVRFPSAFFGTLTVVLTFFIGRSLFTSRAGFLSGLILATSVEFAYLATRANTDTTLTFFTTASLFCFFRWYQQKKEVGSDKKTGRGLLLYGFYVGMAFATLTKGPVGFILPLLICLIYLVAQRDWQGLKGMKLLSGMLVMTALVLAWYAPAVWKGGKDFINQTLVAHTVDRYVGGWSKVRPFYYYFYNFPADFLPWTLFLPGALVYGFSREAYGKRMELLFLLVWFVVIFLFFSLSKGKRELYLLPLYPAASLAIGGLWDDFISGRTGRFRQEWITFPLYGLTGLVFIAGAAIPWGVWLRLPSYLAYSLPMAFLMVGGSVAMFVLCRSKNYAAILFLIVGLMAGGFFYTSKVIFPLVNPYKSARYLSQEIKARIQPEEKLGIYGDLGSGPYNFYTEIVPILDLEKKEDLFHFLQSPGRVFCLLPFRDFYSLQAMEEWSRVQLIARRKTGNNDVVLISNR